MKLSFRVNGTRTGVPAPSAGSPVLGAAEATRPKRFGLRVNRGLSARAMDRRPSDPALDAPAEPAVDLSAS